MILNIFPIIQRIRETDFESASIAKARAIYGILDVLKMWMDYAPRATFRPVLVTSSHFR